MAYADFVTAMMALFLVLWLGGWMAGRHPMRFAVWPGIAYAVCSLLMALSDQPLLFLILGGLATLFETASRPAVTAIIRLNYPADSCSARPLPERLPISRNCLFVMNPQATLTKPTRK